MADYTSETISSAVDFLTKINDEKEVNIQFIKQNGELRLMRATLDFSIIPKDKLPKNSLNLANILKHIDSNGILRVFDLDIKEWRSVPFNRVQYLEINNKKYKIINTQTTVKLKEDIQVNTYEMGAR